MTQMLKNLQVQFNSNIIHKTKEIGLSVDIMGSVIFVLQALYEDRYDLLDVFDDNNREKRSLVLYQTLLRKELIEEADKDETVYYVLSDKGIHFLDSIKSEFEQTIEATQIVVKQATKEKPNEALEDDISMWIKEWIHLFPESKMNGRYLRSNSKECLEKMKWFIKTYEFDKQIIFEATKQYLMNQERSDSGHAFTRNSTYFISKNQGRTRADKSSDLATWCELIVNQRESGITPMTDDPFAKLM